MNKEVSERFIVVNGRLEEVVKVKGNLQKETPEQISYRYNASIEMFDYAADGFGGKIEYVFLNT